MTAEAFHPGELLRDELHARQITQQRFATAIGRPYQAISEICCGRKAVTPATAIDFERALGVSAETWVHLQASFDLHQARKPK